MRRSTVVTSSKKKWIQNTEINEQEVIKVAKELDATPFFVRVCFQRGLLTAEAIREFTMIDESWFHDPFLMHDMQKGIERIVQAIETNEKITVYGDYDADGITSTTLLVETLDSIGANVNYFLPNRFVEGYGPNKAAFEKLIDAGTKLIVTVDNGVTGHEAIDFARLKNIDVIVTDHHEIPETLPNAYAIIHPNHPEGNYPFTDLAGVGVALKVASALIGDISEEMLDLAAIGTVADLVSLTGENRALVYYGLQMIEHTQRVGLIQLLNVIGKEPSDVTEETIGFQIAPRLNAVGRLGDASMCVELLTSHEVGAASEFAEQVNLKNEERKSIVEKMTSSALEQLEKISSDNEVLVLADEAWHQGVLGIVASRIVERTNKPTLLFSLDTENNIAKGSARSTENFNLYEALAANKDLFTQFGGHQMAAGMSTKIEELPIIQENLSEYAKQIVDKGATQTIDAFCSIKDISVEAVKELENLRPFGTDNNKPLIACKNVNVSQKRKVGAEGNHLKLLVEQDENQLDIISFQNGYLGDLLFEQEEVSIAGYIELNEWNGFVKPQMQMVDIDVSGPILVDRRVSQLTPEHFAGKHTTYVFYQTRTYKIACQYISSSSTAILLSKVEDLKKIEHLQELVIVDCPASIEQFEATIAGDFKKTVHCYFYKKNHLFLSGLPSRADFSKAYKFFAMHKNIDLKNQGNLLMKQLNFDSRKIFLIVEVFLEAKFVIIKDGLLNVTQEPEKIDLETTKSYQHAQQELKAEELFLYSSFKEIIDRVTE